MGRYEGRDIMSKDFPEGILWYTTGTITHKVSFPENQVCCRWCDFLKAESDMNRHRCRLTNEMIYTINDIGLHCPIVIDKE